MAHSGRAPGRPHAAEEDEDEITSFLTPFSLESDQPHAHGAAPSAWHRYRRWAVLGALGTLIVVCAVVLAVTISGAGRSQGVSAVVLPESAPDEPQQPPSPSAQSNTKESPSSKSPSGGPSSPAVVPVAKKSPSQSSPDPSVVPGAIPSDAAELDSEPEEAPASNASSCPDFQLPSNATTFLIVGDWGRAGAAGQMEVARRMAQVADCLQPSFVVSTGDNFYPSGLSSSRDPLVDESFKQVYNATSLQVPWYAVLGNHDYGDGIESDRLKHCQLDGSDVLIVQWMRECSIPIGRTPNGSACCFSPLWQVNDRASGTALAPGGLDRRWNLKQGVWQFQASPQLAITFVDTPPFIREYHEKHWANLVGGIAARGTQLVRQQQVALLKEVLKNSSTSVNLVVGHHPVQSNGNKCHGKDKDKEECEDIATWLVPAMKEHKVLAYISGHEHDLQHIPASHDGTPHLVISGAGSDANAGDGKPLRGPGRIFHNKGFVAAVHHERKLTLYYFTARSQKPVFNVTLTAAQA